MEERNEEGKEENNGITIVIHNNTDDAGLKVNPSTLRTVSLIHLVAASITIISQVIITVYNVFGMTPPLVPGSLTGTLYIVTGSLGFITMRNPTKCKVTSFLVLNLFSFLWTVILLVISCSILTEARFRVDQSWHEPVSREGRTAAYVVIVFSALTIITALVQGVNSLTCASLSCSLVCCKTRRAVEQSFKRKPVFIMSIIQIVIGSICVLCYPVNLYITDTFSIYEEIWCGLFFISIGVFGIYTARRGTFSYVTPFLILNVFGSLFALVIITTTVVKTQTADHGRQYQLNQFRNDLDFVQSESYNCTIQAVMSLSLKKADLEDIYPERLVEEQKKCEMDKQKKIISLTTLIGAEETSSQQYNNKMLILLLQLMIVVAEMIITVSCASYSCSACCCGPIVDTTAVYIPQEQLNQGSSVVHVNQNSSAGDDRFNNESTEDDAGRTYSRIK